MKASPSCSRSIFTIPAGLPFVDHLAAGILEDTGEDPQKLAKVQILLPSRRACRSLREAFLRLKHGQPMLLPRMTPIGDVDEEELSLTLSGFGQALELAPSISPLRRQFLLARLIEKVEGKNRGLEQNLKLAAALARLMDQVYTEDLDLKNLPQAIDREDFAEHWQISIDFLKILSEFWPQILEEEGVLDPADRRNRLIKALAAYWTDNPPPHRVVVAGSTGSIPATAQLLKTISTMQHGWIVLPGLDQEIDEESWNNLEDTHPQATLRHLLQVLETKREDIALWPTTAPESTQPERRKIRVLASEVMRPSSTAQAWQDIKERLEISPQDLSFERYDCATPQEEALTIALALRHALEEPERTAALVTPDRKLARRVEMACRKWGIDINDSGGQPLSATGAGTYLRLCTQAVMHDMKPVALLNALKQSKCQPPGKPGWRQSVRRLDLRLLRGPCFGDGISFAKQKFSALEEKGKDAAPLRAEWDFIISGFDPLLNLNRGAETHPLEDWLEAHLLTAEYFCAAETLWAGQDGEAAALLFAELREQKDVVAGLTLREYLAIIEQAMDSVTIRPQYGLHPRLTILGQLEARLVEADIMILGALNENTWPPDPGLDPWMSRPMRKRFGLPSPERSVGLSAHDFVQCLCAKKVVLTRSLRVDGTPTVPSRWLQRMDTVLQACGLNADVIRSGPLLNQARRLHHTESYRPVERPAPLPPVASRPRKLSVTKIDLLMNDPYSIYAGYILKLRPLEPLEQEMDAALRGTMMHNTLNRFVMACPDTLPAGAQGIFVSLAEEEMESLSLPADMRAFWRARLAKIAEWLSAQEGAWRESMVPYATEREGETAFQASAGPFTLTVRADRIDAMRDGTGAVLIDYKSGGTYSKTGMRSGDLPQLPLEGLILADGGFAQMPAMDVIGLQYWVVNGSKDGGTIYKLDKPAELEEAIGNAREGLQNLIEKFDQKETPYFSLPRPEKAPKYNDYEHLARVKEWTALDEEEDAA